MIYIPPTKMGEEYALWQAIMERPTDIGLRLIFTDYLQDNDRVREAEFIRGQIKTGSYLDVLHTSRGCIGVIVNGFVSIIKCEYQDFVERLFKLVYEYPITHFVFYGKYPFPMQFHEYDSPKLYLPATVVGKIVKYYCWSKDGTSTFMGYTQGEIPLLAKDVVKYTDEENALEGLSKISTNWAREKCGMSPVWENPYAECK